MSLSGTARAVRAVISRSDRLYFDTRTLEYTAGIAEVEKVDPDGALELLDAGELKVVSINSEGVIVMELTPEAFVLGVRARRTKSPRRPDWVHTGMGIPSGAGNHGSALSRAPLNTVVALPITSALFNRVLKAMSDALEAYEEDPRRVGVTITQPGHLVPMRALELREHPLDTLHLFEQADLRVMINAANGQVVVGTYVHGLWLGTEATPISKFLSDILKGLGNRAGKSVTKQVEKLRRAPLVKDRVVHQDEESEEVMNAIKAAEKAHADQEAA